VQLSADELDVVKEIFNIGTGKAAKALSDMLGARVAIAMPSIHVQEAEDLHKTCVERIKTRCALVTQPFAGDLTGHVFLLLPDNSADTLVTVLTKENEIEDLAEVDEAALLEIGNIMINGCLSAIADILGRRLKFVFPRVVVQDAEATAKRMLSISHEHENLVLTTEFTLLKRTVWGLFVISMPKSSLDIMMAAVADYLEET